MEGGLIPYTSAHLRFFRILINPSVTNSFNSFMPAISPNPCPLAFFSATDLCSASFAGAVFCSVTGCPPQMRRNQSFSASDVLPSASSLTTRDNPSKTWLLLSLFVPFIFVTSTVLFYFYDKRVAFVTIVYHLTLLSTEKISLWSIVPVCHISQRDIIIRIFISVDD